MKFTAVLLPPYKERDALLLAESAYEVSDTAPSTSALVVEEGDPGKNPQKIVSDRTALTA